jgi:hypothetical protein
MAEDKEVDKGGQQKNSFFPTSESIKMVGGLIAVIVGVGAITTLAIVTMALIDSGANANTIIPLSTAAFGVISAIVGAYLGIKIGTDQTKELAKEVTQAHATLAEAVEKLGDGSGQKKVP